METQRRSRFLAAHGNGQIRSQLHGGVWVAWGGGVRNNLISQNPETQKVCMAPHTAHTAHKLQYKHWTKKLSIVGIRIVSKMVALPDQKEYNSGRKGINFRTKECPMSGQQRIVCIFERMHFRFKKQGTQLFRSSVPVAFPVVFLG